MSIRSQYLTVKESLRGGTAGADRFTFLHIHWMRPHHRAGAYLYRECRCGHRDCKRILSGYSPIDRKWIAATAHKEDS